jgi:Fe-S cluster assembly protein SufD
MTRLAQPTRQTEAYLADFERQAAARAGDPAWLRTLRQRAIDRFAEAGFPTTDDEEWKFTSVAPIAERRFALAENAAAPPAVEMLAPWTGALGGCRLVFVNGAFAPDLAAGDPPAGVQVSSLRAALVSGAAALEPHLGRLARSDRHPFTALNTGFLHDGALVTVAPGTVAAEPISLLFVSVSPDGTVVSHPRVLVVAGDRSQVRIVESYVGPAGQAYFANAVTEVVAGEGAVVDHYKLQRESRGAFHVGTMHVLAGRDSAFSSHSIALGGALVRNEVIAVLEGEGGDCMLNGLYLADGRQLVDNHTTIDHAKPHCGSRELYKGILGGHARAVFNGKIVVRQDAQKTDAKQTNKALLLSDDAQINTKPQLEIFANDVKCTHGAAVGQLDPDALFYLRARGLDARQARDLLIHAFAGDVLGRIGIEALRNALEERLFADMPAADRSPGAVS